MLDILIVEDDQEKLERISSLLCSFPGISLSCIENVVDSLSAKKLLREKCYDILIVDMAIPTRIDRSIENNAGFDLLCEISSREIYKMPGYLIAVTGYDEVYKEFGDKLSELAIPFFLADRTTDDWLEQLKNKVSRIISCKSQIDTTCSYRSFMAIICALESPELNSVLNNGWGWSKVEIPNDETIYYSCELLEDNKIHKIYAAASPHKGMPFAGVISMKMINLFKPLYLAMVGITAGYRDKNNVGDIIGADPVWDWGSGKWVTSGSKRVFQQETYQLDLDVGIRNQLRLMAQNTEIFSNIRRNWAGDAPEHELKFQVGPLASGAAVLADSRTHKEILQQHRGLLGVEMETYAVYAAAKEAPRPKPKVFSLKSVVDFADEEKGDSFQKYAAYTSSETLKFFVENYLAKNYTT